MLQRLEESPERLRRDPAHAELRRWLLLTIADLEDLQSERQDSKCA
ncbi:MAG: hypothetical protein WA399_11250 [Acidobacteriaceae bacterium]